MAFSIFVAVLILGILTYIIFRSKSNSGSEDFFVSTQSQSNERIKDLNLDKASEDASHILDESKLAIPTINRNLDKTEYKADPEREWIIDLVKINGESFNKEDIMKMFDYDWRSNYQSTIFGFSPKENEWTYANAGDSPDEFSKLQVAVNMRRVYNEENPDYDPKKLERYITELEERIKKEQNKVKIEKAESIDNAILKAKKLVSFHKEFNQDAIIVLQSEKQFQGLEVWDALQSLGLTWGDGDLFHWRNNSDFGHDQHFSVWTMTEPGYFLPEEIKDGYMNPNNLVFGFVIPRSADPRNVFDAMVYSAKYCQKRLGGKILNKNGQPFDEVKERQDLEKLIEKMNSEGLIPGSDKALVSF